MNLEVNEMRGLIQLFLLFICLMPLGLMAQDKVVLSGEIKEKDGTPLPSVTVALENTADGIYTNELGRYSLIMTPGKHTLIITLFGYNTIKTNIDIRKNKTLDFVMEENSIILNSVEVYGKTKTQQIKEGAFAVNALDIKPQISLLKNLNEIVNRTTGIKVREEGGVGSDFDLSINGMSGNSVRYFIDGMPLDTKGSGVSLANLPVNIIDRVEIYKGVVPASLGSDALGGAINIITNQDKKDYLDVSYGIGSFHTHKADLNAKFVEPKTGLIIKPTIGVNCSKNDYMMKGVEVWDEDSRKYIEVDRRRFHDDYFSLLGQLEAGFVDKPWADAFFVSGSYSKIDKEIQTGSVQSKVIGDAERRSDSWNVSARYQKRFQKINTNASLSHTWDQSLTVDTAYRIYDWNGNYTPASRNEINGRSRSMRHYNRPLTIFRGGVDYAINRHHSVSLNYLLNRTGNNRRDDIDETFEPTKDVLTKHIIGLTYNQLFFDGRWESSVFIKDYINATSIEQNDLSWITGSDEVDKNSSKSYWGGGAALRYTLWDALSVKASFEHSVRLPLSRELLGNGTTIYPNLTLNPESSNNINLGFFGNWNPVYGHSFYYEANGFFRFVDDFIQATVSEKEGMMQYENIPAVHIKGIEGEVRYSWKNSLRIMLNASFNESRDQKKYKTDGKPSATYNNRVPNRPWLYSNADVSYTFHNLARKDDDLRIGYAWQWIHWYYLSWEAYGAVESKSRIPTQNVSNINLTYSWMKQRYNVSLECSNLFDATVYDNYKLQKPGRSVFAKFRLFIN